MTHTNLRADRLDPRYRFLERRKTLAAHPDVEHLANDIRHHLATAQTEQLRTLLHATYPADLADALSLLNDAEDKAIFDLLDVAEAAEVLDEVDAETTARPRRRRVTGAVGGHPGRTDARRGDGHCRRL
jgi:hypothetical protein